MKRQKKRRSEDGFEQWGGYMNAKISKLEVQFDEDMVSAKKQNENISDIFKGVSIFVNGYTEPSADELRCLMLLHGGTYHHYYRSGKTTHIIASVLPNTKFDMMETLKIVKPEWIVESIKAGKLISYTNYLLQNDFPHALQSKINNPLKQFLQKESGKELKASKTAADEGYLTEFYNNSRLHYISTLGSELKQYVWEMREKSNGVFPNRSKLIDISECDLNVDHTLTQNDVIMHIDMDCFFVSVALRNYPQYKGHPVAVTHARGNSGSDRENVNKKFEVQFYKEKMKSKIELKTEGIDSKSNTFIAGHTNTNIDDNENSQAVEEWSQEVSSMSEIASCSYEARKAGVSKGMYLGAALKLCPNLKTVPYDFKGYREVSMILYNTIAEYTLDIEAVSCDELFVDCTNLLAEVKISPWKFAEIIRQEIKEKTNCTASVGIGKNKLQARLATKSAKPNGQFLLTPDEVNNFMKELDVYELPGVGRTIGAQLKNLSVRNCGDLQRLPLVTLQKEFGGKTGAALYKHCRGEDDKKVNFTHERKSVSAEVNYGIRFNDQEEASAFLNRLSGEVAKRLKDVKMTGKNITLKVMFRAKDAPIETAKYLGHGACDVVSRSTSLGIATNDASVIAKQVLVLYNQLDIPACELRGIGIQITKLETFKKSLKTLHTYFDPKSKKVEAKNGESSTATLTNSRTSGNTVVANLPPEIDVEVFNSLPEHLRAEVLRDYGLQNHQKQDRKAPDGMWDSSINEEEVADSFSDLTFPELKIMIKEWITTEESPTPVDVAILKIFLCRFVTNKNLDKLCILIRCVHRHIKANRSESKPWRKVYNEIVDDVQKSMMTVYGKKLANQVM